METTYLIFVIILFILAISDLVVGVSNDAVNFLNSAIGSKVAKRSVIMIVAAAGVFVGSTFSSGMMEVARKGIFNPQYFTFAEVMVVYMAVMITDIILLDTFNRLGFPTSTTVSIVFEILGGALAMAIMKISNDPNALPIAEYINSSKALSIISGILLSVVVAFSVGAIVQWIVRYFFSFNFDTKIKYFGSIYGGLAITAITYFMLIKGVKGAAFMSPEMKDFVKHNTWAILGICFAIWTVLAQLLVWIFKVNILKIVVLVGTFALAMAFAGNDLVNFIGVPIAGLESFKLYMANPGVDPNALGMEGLAGKVPTNPWLLATAGVIMILTLWFSKNARKVIETGIDLSRQGDGDERFEASALARSIVRGSRNMGRSIDRITPSAFKKSVEHRFDTTEYQTRMAQIEEPPAFDLIRASVNLVVASILISFATSLKLPLSTTYVTFMVAMGTSLADKAWDRESAVFRITGVFTVVGGWFLTALVALTVSFVFALLINFGGLFAVIVLFGFAVYSFLRRKSTKNESDDNDDIEEEKETQVEKYKRRIRRNVESLREVYVESTEAFGNENHKTLAKLAAKAQKQSDSTKELKDRLYKEAKTMDETLLEVGLYHVQTLDFLREAAHSCNSLVGDSFKHVANNHKPLTELQKQEMANVCAMNNEFLTKAVAMLQERNFEDINTIKMLQLETLKLIKESTKSQIKALKLAEGHTRASIVYLNYMQETKNILLHVLNIVKLQRDADKVVS